MAELPRTSSRQRWTLVLVCTAVFMLLLDSNFSCFNVRGIARGCGLGLTAPPRFAARR